MLESNLSGSPAKRQAAAVPFSCAALFVRRDSIYKTMPGIDCYDIERDARHYAGRLPVIAHPPCRAWGSLRHVAKPRPDEKELAVFAVKSVRRCGGVLEHPARSTLWIHCGLPRPGDCPDRFGGFTVALEQFWFGHRAQKQTWIYICGISPADVPPIPFKPGKAEYVISVDGAKRRAERGIGHLPPRKQVSKAEREQTPLAFAVFLVSIACLSRKAGNSRPEGGTA